MAAEVSAVSEAASLLDKIVRLSLESNNFIAERLNVLQEKDFWKNMLEDLQAYARDAETKQSDDQLVGKWLKDLEDLCLDIEDVITDLQLECMRREASSSKFMKFCKGHSIKALKFGHQMKKSFETIKARHKKTIDDAKKYGLIPRLLSEQRFASKASEKRNRGPLKVVHELFGREEEKRSIMYELLSYNHGDPKIGVLPIVGMGGIGKTTIAQGVFNDERVKNFFEVKSWFSVSRDYNMYSIMKGLLDCISKEPGNVSESAVQIQLMENLKGKKFLIILDDLWNDNPTDWELLMAPFREGKAGSKVIVTTRSEHVADMASTVKFPKLQPVQFEDCWKLFCSKVGVSPDGQLDARMEEAGKEIVRNCNGLPLAAAIFGGLLRNKEKLHHWENVRDKKSLRGGDGKVNLMSVMRLSYNDLPGNLKRCFALLAMFPEDHEILPDVTNRLWSAEELIEEGQNNDFIMEELVARSLLISRDNGISYVMHDMVRELACELAGVKCCVVDDDSISRIGEIFKKEHTRHLYFRGSVDSCAKLGEHVEDSSVLRTLFFKIYITESSEISIVDNEVGKKNCFSNLKYLRILDCEGMTQLQYSHLKKLKTLRSLKIVGSQISPLPDLSNWLEWLELRFCENVYLPSNITKLKKLNTLKLNFTNISGLPDSIKSLENLVNLDLDNCKNLNNLPSDIGNLTKLENLRLAGSGISGLPDSIKSLENLVKLYLQSCKNLNNLPSDIGNLTKLEYLWLADSGISGLPDSITSLENLKDLNLENCKNLNYLPSDIGNLKNLEYLSLGGPGFSGLPDSITSLENLKDLNLINCKILNLPSDIGNLTKLEYLRLKGSGISRLPDSITSLVNLVNLDLENCKNLNYLPSDIGNLKNLEYLILGGSGISGLPDSITSLENLSLKYIGISGSTNSIASLEKN